MFITTPDQEYILSILNTTKAMRKLQAALLLKKLDSGKTEQYVNHCLDQLRHIRKIALTKVSRIPLNNSANAVPSMFSSAFLLKSVLICPLVAVKVVIADMGV